MRQPILPFPAGASSSGECTEHTLSVSADNCRSR